MVTDGFHEYADMHRRMLARLTPMIGKKKAAEKVGPPESFYRRYLDTALNASGAVRPENRLAVTQGALTENDWVKAGRPYYRIFPDYVDVFRRTALDVPLRYVLAPFPAFVLRFAEGREPVFDGRALGCLLVGRSTVSDLVRGIGLPGEEDQVPVDDATTIFLSLVEKNPDWDTYAGASYSLTWSKEEGEQTVSRFIEERGRADAQSADSKRVLLGGLASLVLSVCFLATGGDKLIEPDVLNRDFASYLEAVNKRDSAKAKELVRRAACMRYGAPGFTIGREETLLGRRAANREDGDFGGPGDGRELRYQHQRSGHFHKYWTGPNRDNLTVKWVNQLTVRADLPLGPQPDASAPGSRTLTSKAEEAEILGG